MKIKSYFFLPAFAFLMFTLSKTTTANSKNLTSPYLLTVDTLFTPNSDEGWGNYSSYFASSGDSIKMELILNRVVTENINWQQPSLAGTISSSSLWPSSEKTIEYVSPERIWQIQILTNGSCYIKHLSGKLPDGNPVIIPIQTTYKK